MRRFADLPQELQNDAVKPYYVCLRKRRFSLFFKRFFDIVFSAFLIVLLSPVMLAVAIWIKCDSAGPVLYKSRRVTQYGKDFTILKFRTMTVDADKKGSLITVSGDNRITRVGKKIRHARIDEFPQLFNVLAGQMTFVGTRPEVQKYVNAYTDEMMATLLLPAGITSQASINYRDEDQRMAALIKEGKTVDEAYTQHILPEKMKYNLESIKNYSFLSDIKTCIKTIF